MNVNVARSHRLFLGDCGRVAQLGERHVYTVDVTGSSPVPPTIEKENKNRG